MKEGGGHLQNGNERGCTHTAKYSGLYSLVCIYAENMSGGGTWWLKDSDMGQTGKMIAEKLSKGKIRDE